ncbi:MAG TPA: sensor histidine kinase [Bryobacteraceae bacterium]|nr:sensor histidine kinase [Bryobacteraceae bacterium]
MVPYRGRRALRIARAVLSVTCLALYLVTAGPQITWALALVIAYALYGIGALFEPAFESTWRSAVALLADTAFFGVWLAVAPPGWANWFGAAVCGYATASAFLMHYTRRVAVNAGVMALLAILLTPRGDYTMAGVALAAGGVAVAFAMYRDYLERRMSATLRHNVIIRSQAQGAREAERQRIAADFHDGPLQSFISFQMRLEIVRKLLGRDVEAAAAELSQLQELCRGQVGELRSFVRSMRPADEGVSLNASLSRMLDQFQRDTGISTTFAGGDFHDPAELEVSLELLQIVREALNNIQKHSGASRLALSISKNDRRLELTVEDNGGGFPFTGSFGLDELELLRLGPVSIKRRVRLVGGELHIESRPGKGATLQIRVPI